jgi:hypothetical protein
MSILLLSTLFCFSQEEAEFCFKSFSASTNLLLLIQFCFGYFCFNQSASTYQTLLQLNTALVFCYNLNYVITNLL